MLIFHKINTIKESLDLKAIGRLYGLCYSHISVIQLFTHNVQVLKPLSKPPLDVVNISGVGR